MGELECRTIRNEEANGFLHLLCEVFELDFDRASTVFYSEPFYDLDRKYALFRGGEMVSILTTTPLEFGIGNCVGIAGVGTRQNERGRGYAERLLDFALADSAEKGQDKALLFAHQETVYRRLGFETIDLVVRGRLNCVDKPQSVHSLDFEEVKSKYAKWEDGDSRWLKRDERRWKHWQWVYRSCEPAGDNGYFCYEPMLCREAVVYEKLEQWPLVDGAEWLGLRSVTDSLGVPLLSSSDHLLYMARGFDQIPSMFMTDQF